MNLLARHLAVRLLRALLVSALGLAALLWILQLLRVGHHLASAGWRTLGWLLLLSLPSLLIFILPLAALAAVLLVLRALEGTGQLLALSASGLSPHQIAAPCWLVALLAVTGLLGLGAVEPAALARLQDRLQEAALRTLVLEAAPGQFHRLDEDTTLFLERRLPAASSAEARFGGVLLARPGQILLAAEATAHKASGQGLGLRLERGELQLRARSGEAMQRIQFGTFETQLELTPSRLWGFLSARREARSRAPAQAASVLALTLLGAALGLSRRTVRWRLLVGCLSIGGYQAALAGLAGSGLTAELGLSGGVVLGSVCWLRRSG